MKAAILLAIRDRDRAAAYLDALRDAGPWQPLPPVHGLAEALAAVSRRTPELLVADLHLADDPQLDVVRQLRGVARRVSSAWRMQLLLVADTQADPARVLQALRAGADSVYTAGGHSPSALCQQVRETLEGGASMDPWIARQLLDHFSTELAGCTDMTVAALSDPLALTPDERSLLRRLAAGDGLPALARQQAVSPLEITCQVRRLYRKMQLAQHASGLTLA